MFTEFDNIINGLPRLNSFANYRPYQLVVIEKMTVDDITSKTLLARVKHFDRLKEIAGIIAVNPEFKTVQSNLSDAAENSKKSLECGTFVEKKANQAKLAAARKDYTDFVNLKIIDSGFNESRVNVEYIFNILKFSNDPKFMYDIGDRPTISTPRKPSDLPRDNKPSRGYARDGDIAVT